MSQLENSTSGGAPWSGEPHVPDQPGEQGHPGPGPGAGHRGPDQQADGGDRSLANPG